MIFVCLDMLFHFLSQPFKEPALAMGQSLLTRVPEQAAWRGLLRELGRLLRAGSHRERGAGGLLWDALGLLVDVYFLMKPEVGPSGSAHSTWAGALRCLHSRGLGLGRDCQHPPLEDSPWDLS